MASGHVNRTNRPNTWLHRPACKREENPCQLGAVHTWGYTGRHRPQPQDREGNRYSHAHRALVARRRGDRVRRREVIRLLTGAAATWPGELYLSTLGAARAELLSSKRRSRRRSKARVHHDSAAAKNFGPSGARAQLGSSAALPTWMDAFDHQDGDAAEEAKT
jgi:hypothetical protein